MTLANFIPLITFAAGYATGAAWKAWRHLPGEWIDRWRMKRLWRRNRRNSRRGPPAPFHPNCRCVIWPTAMDGRTRAQRDAEKEAENGK